MIGKEKELKIEILSKEDFEKLKEILKNPQTILEQKNYYIDTTSLILSKNGIMLRIRLEKKENLEVKTLTIKFEPKIKNGFFSANQVENSISEKEYNDSISRRNFLWLEGKEHIKILEKYSIYPNELDIIGSIFNKRYIYKLENYKLELDETTFQNGSKDFEIEIETENPEEIKDKILTLLNENNISFTFQKYTKYQRMLKSICKN